MSRGTHVVKENGQVVRIDPNNEERREALAKTLLTPASELIGGRPVTGTKKVSTVKVHR